MKRSIKDLFSFYTIGTLFFVESTKSESASLWLYVIWELSLPNTSFPFEKVYVILVPDLLVWLVLILKGFISLSSVFLSWDVSILFSDSAPALLNV